MYKKVVILAILSLLLFVGGCPIPMNIAICGNDICEMGEQAMCPGDCTGAPGVLTCEDKGGSTCGSREMCTGYWVDRDTECCSVSCVQDSAHRRGVLYAGWNYVSFPQVQLNDAPEDIFAGIVGVEDSSKVLLEAIDRIYTYDGQWRVWHSDSSIPSDLDRIEAGRGYIIVIKDSVNDITVSLGDIDDSLAAIMAGESTARSPHSVDVSTGWNLVGSTYGDEPDKEKPLQEYLWSIDGEYGSLWQLDYDGALSEIPLTYDYNLVPTHAYWIYVTSDGVIIP